MLIGLVTIGVAAADTCEEAAQRYEGCIAEVLGAEAASVAGAKRTEGIAACRADDRTQAMYRTCLPESDCSGFMGCLEDYVRSSEELRPAGARVDDCKRHVEDGKRATALGIVVISDTRTSEQIDIGRRCVIGDTPVGQCLLAEESALLSAYAKQRQADCEAWPEPLAACILGLDTAADCNPDEYPFWRLPIDLGEPGPAVAWQIPIGSWDHDEPWLGWGPDRILVVSDPSGIYGVKGGKERWRLPRDFRKAWVVGDVVGAMNEDEDLELIDVAKGRVKVTVPFEDTDVAGVGVHDDGLIVLGEDGKIHQVPRGCKRPSCSFGNGRISADHLPYDPFIHAIGSHLFIGNTDWFAAWNGYRKHAWDMTLHTHGADAVVRTGRRLAVMDSGGAALLDPVACGKTDGKTSLWLPSTQLLNPNIRYPSNSDDCEDCVLARKGCVVAWRKSLNGSWQIPVPAGEGVAWNDHGIEEETHLLRADGGWKVKTGGFGTVAADRDHVYVISTGLDSEGPVRVLALALATGETVWSTVLPGASTEHEEYSDGYLTVRSGWIAARVGPSVYVLPTR